MKCLRRQSTFRKERSNDFTLARCALCWKICDWARVGKQRRCRAVGRLKTTPGNGDYQAYCDDELNVAWLAYANFAKTTGYSDPYSADGSMPWTVANAGAASLTLQGVNGWRLPKVDPVNGLALNYSHAVNGTTDNGFNISAWRSPNAGITANEIAHLFYNTLSNKGFKNLVGVVLPDWPDFNSGPFSTLILAITGLERNLVSTLPVLARSASVEKRVGVAKTTISGHGLYTMSPSEPTLTAQRMPTTTTRSF
jgi:hypothetical protein